MNITTQSVTYPFGKETRPAFLAQPEGPGPFPGVIVIHEVFGLNDNIKDITQRFARQGYAALAVDMFSGRSQVVCLFRFMAANLRGLATHAGID